MNDWIAKLLDCRARGEAAVLVTVAASKGSVPREAGAKMLVTADAIHGTIGGGHLEYIAIDAARRQLADATPAELRRFPLGASLGQCCGGVVNLLIEPIACDGGWLDTLAALAGSDAPFVIVTRVQQSGGAGKLLVTADADFGTLGDPRLDRQTVAQAREFLDGSRRTQVVTIQTDDRSTAVQLLFDPILKPQLNIVLFGAGHVARALVNVLGATPCRITWVDTRDDEFPAALPANVEAIVTDAPESEVDAAPAGAFFLVMTHSHPLDEQLTERILRRNDFSYFGLIGSMSKRRQFERRLAARGIDDQRLQRMTCPIGVAGIGGKEPGIIAVAVAAQVLQSWQRVGANAIAPVQQQTTAHQSSTGNRG